jgi:sec-independent protein translocase protein TatC
VDVSTYLSYTFTIPFMRDCCSKSETNSETNLLGLYLKLKLSEYIRFLSEIYVSSFIIFQSLILIIVFLDKNKKSLKFIIKTRKFLYLFILIIASILTPPDIINQLCVALPLIEVYEFLLMLLLLHNYKIIAS